MRERAVCCFIRLLESKGVVYCRDMSQESQCGAEDEVLLTAFCLFKVTKLDPAAKPPRVYQDCTGY